MTYCEKEQALFPIIFWERFQGNIVSIEHILSDLYDFTFMHILSIHTMYMWRIMRCEANDICT